MPRVLLAVAILAIFTYGLVDLIRTDGRLTRGFSKTTWVIIMIVLPVIGAVLWFIFGRPRGSKPAEKSYRHPTAPDDDPEFLRNLEQRRRHQAHQAEADRLKRLKEELDSRDREPGDKPDGSRDGDGLK